MVLAVSVAGAIVSALSGIGALPEPRRASVFGFHTLTGGALAVACYLVVAKLAAFGWRAPFLLHLVGLLAVPLILTLPRGIPSHAPRPASIEANGGVRGFRPAFLRVIAFVGMATFIPALFSPFYLSTIGIRDTTASWSVRRSRSLSPVPMDGFSYESQSTAFSRLR